MKLWKPNNIKEVLTVSAFPFAILLYVLLTQNDQLDLIIYNIIFLVLVFSYGYLNIEPNESEEL